MYFHTWTSPAALIAAVVFLAGGACAQTPAGADEMKREIDALRQGQEQLRKDVDSIRQLLRKILPPDQLPFEPKQIGLAGSPARGRGDAKVTLVEFSDLQCAFCVRYYRNTYPRILKDYVDTGKVRYVAREFPLESIHDRAAKASQAALCAGEQDRYWEMRERIFTSPERLAEADFAEHAGALRLDAGRWKSCFESGRYAKKVGQDLRDGMNAGVRGTPCFFLGLTDPSTPGSFEALKIIEGAHPFDSFQAAIEELLNEAGPARP
jgi:protein-disulfide isomerase